MRFGKSVLFGFDGEWFTFQVFVSQLVRVTVK